jgi:hypothetical protein
MRLEVEGMIGADGRAAYAVTVNGSGRIFRRFNDALIYAENAIEKNIIERNSSAGVLSGAAEMYVMLGAWARDNGASNKTIIRLLQTGRDANYLAGVYSQCDEIRVGEKLYRR